MGLERDVVAEPLRLLVASERQPTLTSRAAWTHVLIARPHRVPSASGQRIEIIDWRSTCSMGWPKPNQPQRQGRHELSEADLAGPGRLPRSPDRAGPAVNDIANQGS